MAKIQVLSDIDAERVAMLRNLAKSRDELVMLAREEFGPARGEAMVGIFESMERSIPPMRYVAEPDCDPSYANDFAAGLDLRSSESVVLAPREVRRVQTGLRVELPAGHVGLVRGRSGMAVKNGVWAFEGTIDEDYRGEIAVLLKVEGDGGVAINVGDRIAQLVIVPVVRCRLVASLKLSDTERGTSGFGSTGAR